MMTDKERQNWRELCEEPGPYSPEKPWAIAMLKALDHIDEQEVEIEVLTLNLRDAVLFVRRLCRSHPHSELTEDANDWINQKGKARPDNSDQAWFV